MTIKIITHPATKIIPAVLGFFASVNVMRGLSAAFDSRMAGVFGPLFINRPVILGASIVLMLATSLVLISVYYTRRQGFFHKLDISLLTLFILCILLYCTRQIHWVARFSQQIWIIPVVVYSSVLFGLVQLVVRIRDKTLSQTLYWWRFFQSANAKSGMAMGIMLAIPLLLLLMESLAIYGLVSDNFILRAASPIWHIGFVGTPTSLFIIFFAMMASLCALNFIAAHMLGLSSQYEAANTEKIRAERFKAELITNVSHDIRTPLTSIINYTDLLKKQQLQGDAASYVAVLDKKSTRLKQLLSDLIDASQASTGALKANIEPLNLNEMLGQVSGEFAEMFEERSLTLVIRQPDTPVYVSADSRHLFRAMENVFVNAAKYSMPGTRVFAEIAANARYVNFTLQNISQEPIDARAEELTEQFIRGDLSRHSEGSGLGLYIAKSLIELMGGRLKIHLHGDLFQVKMELRP